MNVPDLVRQAVGDEEIRAGVALGDDDAVLFTATRALVYRGEGLLSDEDVAAYGFDFERLTVSEGRRKTKFTMTYVDAERSFTVPGKRTEDVLAQLLEGTLRVAEAIDAAESVTGVFRFSEMTVVVTDARLLKHVGEHTWDADFEAFDYDDLTSLAFEEGSVATQVVLGVGNRSERIKAPNAEAGTVQKTLQEAVFAHHGVGSLEELNRQIAVESADEGRSDATGGLGLDSGIDPLVSDEDEPAPGGASRGQQSGSTRAATGSDTTAASTPSQDETASQGSSAASRASTGQAGSGSSSAGEQPSREQPSSQAQRSTEERRSAQEQSPSRERSSSTSSGSSSQSNPPGRDGEGAAGGAKPNSHRGASEEAAVHERLAELTRTVERQNELLRDQQRTIQQLIEELRQGR